MKNNLWLTDFRLAALKLHLSFSTCSINMSTLQPSTLGSIFVSSFHQPFSFSWITKDRNSQAEQQTPHPPWWKTSLQYFLSSLIIYLFKFIICPLLPFIFSDSLVSLNYPWTRACTILITVWINLFNYLCSEWWTVVNSGRSCSLTCSDYNCNGARQWHHWNHRFV